MSSKLNVAFFGTSDRSIPILEALENSNFNLCLCITKDDVKVGRKQILKPTAVKVWALGNRVQTVTIDRLNTQSTARIVEAMKTAKVELGVIADFSFIMPEEILSFPTYKLVNIHFSLLPNYRGASPVQFAILNRDKETGITYLITTKGVDEGPIIFQTPYQLLGTETSGQLYKTLFEIAAQNLPKVLEDYTSGKLVAKEQDNKKATYTYSSTHPKNTFIFKEDAKVSWQKTPTEIDAMVRAFNPWPIAWSTLNELLKAKTPIYDYPADELKNNDKRTETVMRIKIYETSDRKSVV